MRGFIEIKEDTYEDTIEHLHRLKTIACKMIKKLEEHSEAYNDEDLEDDHMLREKRMPRGRYGY